MTPTLNSMILDLANDYTGLWEFVSGASATDPDRDYDSLVKELRRGIESLIGDGRLELYPGVRFSGDAQPVPKRDVPARVYRKIGKPRPQALLT